MAKLNQAMNDLMRYNGAMTGRKRSSFNKSHSHTTTFDSGYIIPIMWDRVLPCDEKKIQYSGLCRMSTPIHPVMDEAYWDVYAFYVPDRLWWSHAKQFYGENLDASFNPDGEYQMPSLTPKRYAVYDGESIFSNGIGSLNDYFGFPVMSQEVAEERSSDDRFLCTAGLHRSYQLIWNEWFRNSSIQPSLQLNDGDYVTDEEWNVIKNLRLANKFPDYFTTLLREPQLGPDVVLPLSDWAPVVTRPYDSYSGELSYNTGILSAGLYPNGEPKMYFGYKDDFTAESGSISSSLGLNNKALGVNGEYTTEFDESVVPRNLWANISSTNQATINNLRAAITVQHFLETANIAGRRYQQILFTFFGCLTPDATLQRPELLGQSRTTLNVRQVIQQSESSNDSPLGNVGAISLTNMANQWVTNKSFTEPGILMIVGVVRPVMSYSQGINPLLQKLNKYEHYWPVFDNLGNQPVYKRTIYAGDNATTEELNEVFGYSEAWIDYRIMNNRVSGLMRPDVNQTLASWNYSTYFDSCPSLTPSFIEQDPNFIERTIAVPSQPQFICDSYFDYIDIKNMGVHSVPGLTRL